MINTIVHPDADVGVENHKHLCKRCGTCWTHGDDVANGEADDFDEAHECPTCGREETFKHITEAERRAKLDAMGLDASNLFERRLARILFGIDI